ncbi:MAG: glycosyltransferase family protein [Isosphaeraceae bacterium]|jgi:spore coat polysaccharide biosynthesis protein SpsF
MDRRPKVLAIIQARMGSSRLPGKVLLDLAGEPMLARVVHRMQRAEELDEVVIATTTEPADDILSALCADRGWPCFRGSQDDVLDRYYQAAQEHRADLVVRVTSDCPLIEPEVIDRVVRELLNRCPPADYACNVLPRRTYPRGLDVEAFWFETLKVLWQEDQNPAWREHVNQFLHHHPERFVIHGVLNDRDLSGMRWTVDTPEDFDLVRRIYREFGHDSFTWQEVLTLLKENPQWLEINRHVPQKVVQ